MTDRIHRFIVPLKGVNTFCTFRDGEIVPANSLPMVGHDGHAIDEDFGWVAWIADDGKAVGRTHLDAVAGEGGFAPLRMPEGYTAGCLLFHRQTLFVGGQCGTEILGAFDLASDDPKWMPLEVPKQFRQDGKRIDDLLLDGDRLIAVDDHEVPKYLLVYGASDPRRPILKEVRRVPTLWWGERIYAGAIGSTWLALLSVGGGTIVGSRSQIGLYDRETLGLYGWLASLPERRGFGISVHMNRWAHRTWNRVSYSGDTLLIAAGSDGVGVLELSELERPANPVACDPNHYGPFDRSAFRPEHEQFSQECETALRYVRPPGVTGSVSRVAPIPNTRHCLIVFETEPGFDTAVMELP